MDFIHDQFADGIAFRVLSIIDLYTYESVGLGPGLPLRTDEVEATLSRLGDERGILAVIECHNGPEFTSVALDHWATGTRCASTSVDPANRRTTRSS